jgi:8-oxo-dGTP diphosphatase
MAAMIEPDRSPDPSRPNPAPQPGEARFQPIVGTLGYLWDRTRDRVLLIRRNRRPDDDHYGKVNGLGGKVEVDESITEGLRREIQEEASVEITSFRLRGTITWSNFGPKREQWLGFLFLIDGWDGEPATDNPEGTLEWVARHDLLAACAEPTAANQQIRDTLPMWAGDRYFVPLVFDDDPRAFHGTMPYDGDRPRSWSFERLGDG